MRFDQLAKMTDGRLLTAACAELSFTGVSVDSRTLMPDQLFFAVAGENTDGHRFIDNAIEAGAAGIVLQRGYSAKLPLPQGVAVVEVPDTHAAMLNLAAEYLGTVDARRVGITGSNGKTTTKEFAFQLLSAVDDRVYRSPGNFNNLFGIPLALFAMPADTTTAVLEMGISTPGEMDRLAGLVRPHMLAVTNIGATHLEFLGTVEAVAHEKLKAMRYAEPKAPLIVNADDPVLIAEADRVLSDYVTFGMKKSATFSPDSIEMTNDGMTVVTIEGHRFRRPLFGSYQVYNLLAAYAIVRELGFAFDNVATEDIRLSTTAMRGELVRASGITFVSDCYNANPESVRAGLASFARFPDGTRRVIILGDMLELGDESARYHAEVGGQAAQHAFDLLVAVGPLSTGIIEAARAAGVPDDKLLHFDDAAICADEMSTTLQSGDLVYLKGSRGIGLEAVLHKFSAGEEQA